MLLVKAMIACAGIGNLEGLQDFYQCNIVYREK
jgi:hypothetical protein